MKKLINAAENVVNESLAGFCAAHSNIVRIGEHAPFVQRRHLKPGKVALVSGGGSGHEPLHSGFVGHGMLDAACPGQVFTSPTPDLILAAAEEGRDLASLKALGDRVNAATRSIGIALTSCTVPAAGKPTFDIAEDEMEVGVGIHGEPGRRRVKLRPATEIAAEMVQAITTDLGPRVQGEAILLINGFGATPLCELYLMYNAVRSLLEPAGTIVTRSLVGNFVTSLDMAGCSVTVSMLDDEMKRLWDAPVHTPALRWGI